MVDVFFSYKREDRAAVERLVRLLEAERFAVWWDPAIVPGERYAAVIRRALNEAACVVVAWSHRSIESIWVQDEAGIARDRGVLVPVSLDGVEPPLGFTLIQSGLRRMGVSGRCAFSGCRGRHVLWSRTTVMGSLPLTYGAGDAFATPYANKRRKTAIPA